MRLKIEKTKYKGPVIGIYTCGEYKSIRYYEVKKDE